MARTIGITITIFLLVVFTINGMRAVGTKLLMQELSEQLEMFALDYNTFYDILEPALKPTPKSISLPALDIALHQMRRSSAAVEIEETRKFTNSIVDLCQSIRDAYVEKDRMRVQDLHTKILAKATILQQVQDKCSEY